MNFSRRTGPTFGALFWGVCLLATVAGFIKLAPLEIIFLLAPLVLVPLGFELVPITSASSRPGRLAYALLPISGGLVPASFIAPLGPSAWLCGGWAIVCALAATDALLRLLRGGYRSAEGVLSSAGFIYLFIGSVCLVLSRQESTPFNAQAMLNAAMGFHFTGFALPIVASAAARARRTRLGSEGSLFPYVAAGLLLGVALASTRPTRLPLVLATAGTFLLIVASYALAGLIVSELRGVTSKAARALLAISALSLVLQMALGAAYTVGQISSSGWMPVLVMTTDFYGWLNTLVYPLCGLLGWVLESRCGAGA